MIHVASTVFKDLNGLSHHVKINLVILKMENSSNLRESSSIAGIFLRVSCGILLSHHITSLQIRHGKCLSHISICPSYSPVLSHLPCSKSPYHTPLDPLDSTSQLAITSTPRPRQVNQQGIMLCPWALGFYLPTSPPCTRRLFPMEKKWSSQPWGGEFTHSEKKPKKTQAKYSRGLVWIKKESCFCFF